jgi:cytoskeleton protein RodZ
MDAVDQQTGSEEPAAEPATLGQALKNARTARGLTLEQVSSETRIEVAHLQALEQDLLGRIGPTVFVKGYLRQYGQLLGLDYRHLLDLYYRQAERQEIVFQPNRPIKLRDERQIAVWVLAAIALAALVVLLIIWWLNDASRRPAPASAARVTTEEVERLRSWRTVSPALEGEVAPVDRALVADAARGGGGESFPEPVVRVDIVFEQDCWTEITDARGERLFFGLGRPGTSSVVVGEAPIVVLLGNADGVHLTVDGTEYPIPADARRGNLARFTLTARDD